MKILVTYYSQTGNTRDIAKSIFENLPGKKELKELNETQNTEGFDLVYIGFPIYNFEPVHPVKEFLLKYSANKNIVMFMTMALTAVPKNDQMNELYDLTIRNCRLSAPEANVLGVFDCPGELSELTAKAMLNSDNPMLQAFGKMRSLTIGYPNEKNKKDAGLFALEILDKFIRNNNTMSFS